MQRSDVDELTEQSKPSSTRVTTTAVGVYTICNDRMCPVEVAILGFRGHAGVQKFCSVLSGGLCCKTMLICKCRKFGPYWLVLMVCEWVGSFQRPPSMPLRKKSSSRLRALSAGRTAGVDPFGLAAGSFAEPRLPEQSLLRFPLEKRLF